MALRISLLLLVLVGYACDGAQRSTPADDIDIDGGNTPSIDGGNTPSIDGGNTPSIDGGPEDEARDAGPIDNDAGSEPEPEPCTTDCPPTLLELGATCAEHADCASNYCPEGTCEERGELRVTSSSPQHNQTAVPASARVRLAFNTSIVITSIAGVVLRDALGNAVAGVILMPGDDAGGFYDYGTETYYPAPLADNELIFQPAARLAVGGHYTLDLSALLGQGDERVPSPAELVFTVLDAAQIVAGGAHTVMLEGDGSVWAWGWSVYGAAGSAAVNTSVFAPSRVVGPTGLGSTLGPAMQVAASDYSSLALLQTGHVYAWGKGDAGQLGDGNTYPAGTGTPVLVADLDDVTAVAAGGDFSLALRDNGTVWAFGANDRGQLGDGSEESSTTPVQVMTDDGALDDVIAIAAGGAHALALLSDGTVVGWGSNSAGQLGSVALSEQLVAAPITGLASISALSARSHHSLALDRNGTVWRFGAIESKVGGGVTWTHQSTPTAVAFGSGVKIVEVRAGYRHFLALDDTGALYGFGLDFGGELFGPAGTDRPTPVQVGSFASPLVDFDAGGGFAGSHSVYVSQDAYGGGAGSSNYGQTAWFQ